MADLSAGLGANAARDLSYTTAVPRQIPKTLAPPPSDSRKDDDEGAAGDEYVGSGLGGSDVSPFKSRIGGSQGDSNGQFGGQSFGGEDDDLGVSSNRGLASDATSTTQARGGWGSNGSIGNDGYQAPAFAKPERGSQSLAFQSLQKAYMMNNSPNAVGTGLDIHH